MLSLSWCLYFASALVLLFRGNWDTPVWPFYLVWVGYYTDMYSAFLHITLDNSRYLGWPIIGEGVADFLGHHVNPRKILTTPMLTFLAELNVPFAWTATLTAVFFVTNPDVVWCQWLFFVWGYLAHFSHCHSHTPKHQRKWFLSLLQKCRIFMSDAHHKKHHAYLNTHYSTLSGWATPVIEATLRWLPQESYFWIVGFSILTLQWPMIASIPGVALKNVLYLK